MLCHNSPDGLTPSRVLSRGRLIFDRSVTWIIWVVYPLHPIARQRPRDCRLGTMPDSPVLLDVASGWPHLRRGRESVANVVLIPHSGRGRMSE